MATKLNETAEKVLAFLNANKGKEFTLAEIAIGIGKEMKSAGAINSLVSNGTISKGAPREVERKVTAKVSTYKVD